MPGTADEAGAAEAEYRPLLFFIAYGITGSVGDAEDRVQHAFRGLTGARQAGTTIADPKAYLTTTVTRLGINHLHSARMRRETYMGDWLREPIVVPGGRTGTGRAAELADSLSMAFLVLLERPSRRCGPGHPCCGQSRQLGHIGPVSDVARLPEKELPQHRYNR